MLGKKNLGVRTGRPEQVAADGSPEWLPIGVNIAWEEVPAATVAATLADGTQVRVGERAIERGTVMSPVTTDPDSEWSPAATADTLERNRVGILNTTIKDSETIALGVDTDSEISGLISGGLVWRERLNVGGAGEPTLANVLAAMPRLELTPPE